MNGIVKDVLSARNADDSPANSAMPRDDPTCSTMLRRPLRLGPSGAQIPGLLTSLAAGWSSRERLHGR